MRWLFKKRFSFFDCIVISACVGAISIAPTLHNLMVCLALLAFACWISVKAERHYGE